MIGLLLPWHLNLDGGAAPPAATHIVATGSAKALPLTSLGVADVVPNAIGSANVEPLLVQGVAEREFFFLAIKGGQHFAGDLTTATDTTAFGETGVGFQPKSVMFLSHCLTQSTADTVQETTGDYWTMGAVDEALNQGCHATLDDDAATVAEVAIGVEHDSVYLSISTADAKDGGMTVNSLDSDGMTLQMNDADPSGKFVWYWALGSDPVAPGGAFGARRPLLGVGR